MSGKVTLSNNIDIPDIAEPESEPEFDWSDEQAVARDAVAEWYNEQPLAIGYKQRTTQFGIVNGIAPIFRLFGYAGTGKTTVVRPIVRALGLDPDSRSDVLYGAYTGKAAHVLNTKGVPAETIHSMIYRVSERDRTHLHALEVELRKFEDAHRTDDSPDMRARIIELESMIAHEKTRLRRPKFLLNPGSDVQFAKLVVLDEVSMVDQRMAADILSFGTPLLVLGDPAQLPPVAGDGYFTDAAPDAMLSTVHRSALDSPVTRIATAVRSAPVGDRFMGVPGMDEISGRVSSFDTSWLLSYDVVLCWRNAVRWNLIENIRLMLGFPSGIPTMGDKIIVLQNNRELGVFNGQVFDVLGAWWDEGEDIYSLALEDGNSSPRLLDVYACGFRGAAGQTEAEDLGRKRRGGEIAVATFAQAMTVHKAQGSEWDRVLVVDESPGIWGMKAKTTGDPGFAHAEARRWLYTAVTRAASVVNIVPSGR